MGCETVKLGNTTAIVCGRGRRAKSYRCGFCHFAGGFQCDWKVSKGKTCDEYICPDHATEMAHEKHVCPLHLAAWETWVAEEIARGSEPKR